MKNNSTITGMTRFTILVSLLLTGSSSLANDTRQFVELPSMMQQHMLANMRDHLRSLNDILTAMGESDLDTAADIAEQRLGMSSLDSHGASHMARYMPAGMRRAGTTMHRAASRFARKAQEGELMPAYRMLPEITAACVACHAAYRIR